jgi:hypothetical protein
VQDLGKNEFYAKVMFVNRILSAIVLVLWTGCFFYCSAEKYGLVECPMAENQCSPDCEPAECSDSDSDSEDPCGLCEFLDLGGVPTLSQLAVDAAVLIESDADDSYFRILIERHALSNGVTLALNSGGSEQRMYVHLYEFRARKTLPVRGPNV